MLAVCCLLLSALCLRAELAFKWTVEVSQPLPYAAEALQGESFNLEAKVVQYRVPMLEAAEATFYYQTPEMEASQWYTVPAAWDATTATASVAFTPAMDVGSTKYRFFFGIETAQGKNYRVFGTLRLKASPGFSPATLTPTDVRAEMIQEILEAVFEESDERYASKAEHAALAVQVQGKADAFTVGEGLTLEAGVLSANAPKITVDSTLSSTSKNPVQNKAVYSALNGKVDKPSFDSFKVCFNADSDDKPHVRSRGGSMHALKTIFDSNNEADNWAEKFDNAKITFEWWHQYSGVKEDSLDVPISAFRALAEGGGGNTEVWKGNVGFGEQDTFFGPKAVASGEGQFYKGYPRLHNHGQDIHEVSGFSRDSRDDESVWSHRLLLPWDLAKANDTSYLMAGVVWNGKRRILNHPDYGLETTFVQPLIPENTGGTKDYGITHAIPCFENSPMYWNGNMIFNDSAMLDSGVPAQPTKAVIVPWARVEGLVGSPSELALKSDIDNKLSLSGGTVTGSTTFTEPLKIQNGDGTGSLWIGGNVNSGNLSNKNRHLARIVVPCFNDITKGMTLLGFDSSGDADLSITNKGYDVVSFGGSKKITNASSPLGISFCVTKTRESMSAADKVYALEMDANAAKFNVQPYYNGTPLALKSDVDSLETRIVSLEAEGPSEPEARTSSTLGWQANTSLLTVTPDASGAITFDVSGWPEGQSLLVRLTTPDDFELPETVRLVGYFDIEPASTYHLTAYVVGGVMHLVPLVKE